MKLDIDDRADEAYDAAVVQYLDDEIEARAEEAAREAKRRAAGISKEELSLQEAFIEGQRAGGMGLSQSLNPYQDGFPEHHEWLRGWRGAAARRAA